MMWLMNLSGLLLIVFIIWWFWVYESKESSLTNSELPIEVSNGVYQPSKILCSAGQPVILSFIRKDASPCAEMVVFPDLEISESLPMNQVKKISLPALKKGRYAFHCQMQMYRGELIVE